MEVGNSVTSPKRATKAATVSALSLRKRKNVCEKNEEQLQGSVTRGRRSKQKTEKEQNGNTGFRKTCRHVKIKKYEDFEYGNTTVTRYKQRRESTLRTSGHTVKGLKKEKDISSNTVSKLTEHVRKVYSESSRGRKIKEDRKNEMICLEDAPLVSKRNKHVIIDPEVRDRRRVKRKQVDGAKNADSVDRVSSMKGNKNPKDKLKYSNKGKIAKLNETHFKDESSETVNANLQNIKKSKIYKEYCGTKTADEEKDEGTNKSISTISHPEVNSLEQEQDRHQEKHESGTNVDGTVKKVKERVTDELDVRTKTRTRSLRNIKKKVDSDFEYYMPEKFTGKTSAEITQTDRHKNSNQEKEVKAENVDSSAKLLESESIKHDEDSLKDVPHSDSCKKAPCTDVLDIKCLKCNLSFSERVRYVKHIKELHKTLTLCEHCDTFFETGTELQKHLKELHNDVKEEKSRSLIYKCTYKECTEEFGKEIHRQKHVNSTHLNTKHHCEFCGIYFKQSASLKRHIAALHADKEQTKPKDRKIKEPRSYKCPYEKCSKEFNNISNRKKHVDNVHLNIRNFLCEFCDHRFKTSSNLKLHIAARHTRDDDKKLYRCNICSKSFLRKASLQLHETLHTNTKSYLCSFEDCGKSFRLKSNLAKHEKIHNDVKPHQCDVCQERFSRKTYLETHMYKHTGVKNYSCDICQKSFSQKGNLMTHKLLHSRERTIYKCPRCSQTFNFKSNMKKHLQRHNTHAEINENSEETESKETDNKYTVTSWSDDIGKVSERVKSKATLIGSSASAAEPKEKLVVGAFKRKKIWVTPTILGLLEKGANTVVLMQGPQKDKDQGNSFKKVSVVQGESILNTVSRIDNYEGSSGYTVSKPVQQSSMACSAGQRFYKNHVDSVVDTSDNMNDDQHAFVVSNDVPGLSDKKASGSEIRELEGKRSSPVHVCIEDITYQVSDAGSTAEKGQSKALKCQKSVVELPVMAERNSTFTIEFDVNGMPFARLKETDPSPATDCSHYVSLDAEETGSQTVMSEHTVTDDVKASHKSQIVETTSGLLAVIDSTLQVTAENPNNIISTVNDFALPTPETMADSNRAGGESCSDMHEPCDENVNANYQQYIDTDTKAEHVTNSDNQNCHSLLNDDIQYTMIQNMTAPFSESAVPKHDELNSHILSNVQSAEIEIRSESNDLGDVLSKPYVENKVEALNNTEYVVRMDSVDSSIDQLIASEEIVEETPVENF